MNSTYMQDAIKRDYDSPGVGESYARQTELLRAEEFILSYLADELKNKVVLDVGVGAGRTLPYLRALTENYTGVDYSENMLKHCRLKHGDASLLLCDARNMDVFEDGAFDAVFLFYNIIDDANHEDRRRILGEVRRVLKRHGLFVFSTHNLDFHIRSAYKFRGFVPAQNTFALLKENGTRVKRYFTGIVNHLRNKRKEVRTAHYSILNDSSHNYRLLTYYIDRENQLSQLAEAGFAEVEMVEEWGSFISAGEECRDGWVYYICRKAG
jgi:ubiquinone/menaquinone biosynthesis C-methylase UbiE